jgi:SHC-transforming protein 4
MDGDYLVRTSNKTADKQYVLSGRYKGEYRHIFLVDPTGVVRTKDRVFDDICHLIKYHQDNNIPIVSKDNELLLENPIPRFS